MVVEMSGSQTNPYSLDRTDRSGGVSRTTCSRSSSTHSASVRRPQYVNDLQPILPSIDLTLVSPWRRTQSGESPPGPLSDLCDGQAIHRVRMPQPPFVEVGSLERARPTFAMP